MILAFSLDPNLFHSPSPFCFSCCSISKVSIVKALIKFSFTWKSLSDSIHIHIVESVSDFGLHDRVERLQGSVHNMNQFIKCLRSWKHLALWDVQPSLQNEIICWAVHQAPLWENYPGLTLFWSSRRRALSCIHLLLCVRIDSSCLLRVFNCNLHSTALIMAKDTSSCTAIWACSIYSLTVAVISAWPYCGLG